MMPIESVAIAYWIQVEVLDSTDVIIHKALVLVLLIKLTWHVSCSSFHCKAFNKVILLSWLLRILNFFKWRFQRASIRLSLFLLGHKTSLPLMSIQFLFQLFHICFQCKLRYLHSFLQFLHVRSRGCCLFLRQLSNVVFVKHFCHMRRTSCFLTRSKMRYRQRDDLVILLDKG